MKHGGKSGVMILGGLTFITGTAIALAGGAGVGGADLDAAEAFEKLKSLAGTWETDTDQDGKADFEVVYRVTAAGSVVEATIMPGEQNEMVTLYSIDGDDLVMTHYCALGNQPHMKCVSAEDDTLAFELVGGGNMTPGEGLYMGAAKIVINEGELREQWATIQHGEPMDEVEFVLTRKAEREESKSFIAPDGTMMVTRYFVELSAGPNRDHSPEEAAKLQEAHLANISRLHEEGYIWLAGPFGDERGGGIFVMRADSLDHARELVGTDPAIKAGRLKVDIRPWWVAKSSDNG